MKALAIILLLLSTTFQEVAKSKDGVLKASVTDVGERYLIAITTSNLRTCDSLFIHTTNDWKVKLNKATQLAGEPDQFIINPIQASVLREEEIVSYEVFQQSKKMDYSSTDRSYLKNRLK